VNAASSGPSCSSFAARAMQAPYFDMIIAT
jgi:hypothetical protein